MDGSFTLQRDPDAASPPPDKAAWQQEITDAKAGNPPSVSTHAAAFYLGVHYKTFLAWVRSGCGPDPIKNPVRPGTTARNQRMRFTLEALDAFQQSRTGSVITRGMRTDTERVQRETERIQAAIDLKAAQDQLAKARERAKRHGIVCFLVLADTVEVQPWARIDDRLVGHAWVVDDAAFDAAGDDLVEATLEEALAMPWASEAARAPYATAFDNILGQIETALAAGRTRQRAQDLENNMGEAQSKTEPPRFAPTGGRL